MKDGDVICEEHGTVLGDDDLISAICDAHGMTREQFDSMSLDHRHNLQISWVSPMPFF